MVGCDTVFRHAKILEKIIGIKLSKKTLFRHLVALRAIKLDVAYSVLYININSHMHITAEQKTVLKKLRDSKKYKDYTVDSYAYHVDTEIGCPSVKYIRNLLKPKKINN